MQKIVNKPNEVVEEMLDGFVKAHPDIVATTPNKRVIKYKHAPILNKVGIVTGGGSGHKPAFIGYLGRNMVDSVAVGELFSSPPAQMFFDAIKEADSGRGVACLYGNYMGDNMNMKMAIKMAEKAGIKVKTVVANDDVPSASSENKHKRRGVAGEIFMWKVGGAAAAKGLVLDDVIAAAQKAIDNTRSIGVGLAPCVIPEVGHSNFIISEGTMEIGIGHHGEPGIEVAPLESANQIALRMVSSILNDFPLGNEDEVAVLVSGLGSTTYLELYILFNEVEKILQGHGIKIYYSLVGNYFTSLEMGGATLTIMKLDKELKDYIDLDAEAVMFKKGRTH